LYTRHVTISFTLSYQQCASLRPRALLRSASSVTTRNQQRHASTPTNRRNPVRKLYRSYCCLSMVCSWAMCYVINKRFLEEARGYLRLKCDRTLAGDQGLGLRKSHIIPTTSIARSLLIEVATRARIRRLPSYISSAITRERRT